MLVKGGRSDLWKYFTTLKTTNYQSTTFMIFINLLGQEAVLEGFLVILDALVFSVMVLFLQIHRLAFYS